MVKKYSKLNFVEAVKIITPDLYLNEDQEVSGLQVKFTDNIVNSHLASLNSISQTLNVSALAGSPSFSSIDTPSGFSQYFIKQNKLTSISSRVFEKQILRPLGFKFSDYSSSSDFFNFLSGTLLPKITLNSNTLLADTSSLYSDTPSGTHAYLISNISWLYFLNTNGPVTSPSSIVASSIVDKLYTGGSYLINDGIKDYQTYIWDNYSNFSSIDPAFIPDTFLSGTGTFTSGNQNLDKLKTFIDVIYSPLYIDREDESVRDTIEYFLNTNVKLQTTEVAGPFNKFLRAVSYSLRDIDNQVESIETLQSIENCPSEFLPFMASLLGWTLYGNNEDSWRNQLKNAVRLYKKKGTKEGLVEAMNTVIVQNPIDVSSSVVEMYESYLPRLLYYLLLTETDFFDLRTYTAAKGLQFGIDPESFSPSNKEQNIKAAVDVMLKRAVAAFPHLFFLKNEPFRINVLDSGKGWFGPVTQSYNTFDTNWYTGEEYSDETSERVAILGDPAFVFTFRGRDYPIPPWDDEKFYRNCSVTQELLNFFKNELERFCISTKLTQYFVDYVQSYTVAANSETDLYLGNGFVLFTSSLQYPPNYATILNNKTYTDYDALSLWNGKSSTFDFTVCAGDFSSVFFQDSAALYTTAEILDTLKIVDEFTPAKAVPRTRVIIAQNEVVSGIEFACPSLRFRIADVPAASGVLSNYEVCGVFDRGTSAALGSDLRPGFDDSRSILAHANLPVFTRKQVDYSNNVVSSVVSTSAVVPSTSAIPRRSLRRRNFYNTLNKKGWYGRDGHNMPTFYNNTSSIIDFLPLGVIPSSLSFADAGEYNLKTIWGRDCAGSSSNKTYFGLDVSNAFLTRNYDSLTFSSCDQFVRRDILPEEVYTLFKFGELKKAAIAQDIFDLNYDLLAPSSTFLDLKTSFANQLPDDGLGKFLSPILDKRKSSGGRNRGIHDIYNTYNKYFLSSVDGSSLPESALLTLNRGGPTILSHTYGPIYFNSDFDVDGSAIADTVILPNGQTGSDLITTNITKPYLINLTSSGSANLLDAVGVSSIESSSVPYYGTPEIVASHFVSGVSLIDTSADSALTSQNLFAIYNLTNENTVLETGFDNHMIRNPSIFMQHGGLGLPRIKYNLSGASTTEQNILIPEHDFELSVDFLTGRIGSGQLGGGNIGILLRTKVETIYRDKSGDSEEVVFFWSPKGKWEMEKVSNLVNPTTSISHILSNHTHKFAGGEIINVGQDGQCDETFDNNTLLRYVNQKNVQTAKINFHTKNKKTSVPLEYGTNSDAAQPTVYNGRNVLLHRAVISDKEKSQDYILEIFQLPKVNPEKEFVVIDKFSLVDKTLNEAAAIPYEARIPNINYQSMEALDPVFLLPNGEKISFSPVNVGIISPYQSYSENDLFRTMQGVSYSHVLSNGAGFFNGDEHPMRYNSELWNVIGHPNTDTYQETSFLFHSAQLMSWFFQFSSEGITHDDATYGDKYYEDFGPWGKLPLTAICNNTWNAWSNGFNTCRTHATLSNDMVQKGFQISFHFNDRKGFLSFNQWVPYITVGEQTTADQGLIGETWGWGKTQTIWNERGQNANGDNLEYVPLIGLALAGRKYNEQYREGSLWGSLNMTLWPTGEKNPLGYTRIDDAFSFANLHDNIGDGPSMDSNQGGQPWWGLEQVPYSLGAPVMIDFTTRRRRPPELPEGLSLQQKYDLLDNPLNWSNVLAGGDHLLPSMLDPLGYVPSAIALHHEVRTNMNGNHWQSPTAGQYDGGPDNTILFDWENDGNPWQDGGMDNFFIDGHGITFPAMSVYRDVERDKLVHEQKYTFSVYVRGNSWDEPALPGIDPDEVADLYALDNYKNLFATSAILTLAPIGSKNSYTRVVLSIPDVESGVLATSSILTNGHSLTGEDAARISTSAISTRTGFDDEDLSEVIVNWYKMEVTLPYDAMEDDISDQTNLGLRCTLQAYNDRFDDIFPDVPEEPVLFGGDELWNQGRIDEYLYVPCKLYTWGYGLYPAESAGDFRRKVMDCTKLGRGSMFTNNDSSWWPGGVAPPYYQFPGMIDDVIVYDSKGNNLLTQVENEEAYLAKTVVQGDDDQLHIYDRFTSGLQKLTLVQDTPNFEDIFKSNLYKGISFTDSRGVPYSGPMTYGLVRKMLRPEKFAGELESDRWLSPKGSVAGTNIGNNTAGSIPIEPIDLLHIFKFFNKLGKKASGDGFNTRVAADSSGIHDLSGGSRLAYRINPNNPTIGTTNSTYGNFTDINIIN